MKRIAFIKQDGTIALVLNCDDKLFASLTAGYQIVDATQADELLTFNWTYDGANFVTPVTVGE